MFAVDVARPGIRVIGVDPAAAMLDVARRRPGADRVEWVHGTADDAPSAVADLVIMMGHVAQYFVGDDEWAHALREVHRMLASGGRLAFETRNPAIDWVRRWTRESTIAIYPHPDGGEFTSWVEMCERTGSPESYTTEHAGHTLLPDGTHVTCRERLRFRSTREISVSLDAAGFVLEATWGDWDGSPVVPTNDEIIVLARRTDDG